jgi:hypothetical protein
VKHLQPGTISGYVSGVKSALVSNGYRSSALGAPRERHYLVAKAIRSLSIDTTVPPKPPREEFTIPMMRRAARMWPFPFYAMAVLIRGFILRSGELMFKKHKASKHLLYWVNIVFLDREGEVMSKRRWSSELAYGAEVKPSSRKHQARKVRKLPARQRTFFPHDGCLVSGLTSPDANGCVVAALQGWYVLSGAAGRDLANTPICRSHDGRRLTQEDMLKWCHEMGDHFKLPKGTLVIHSLKHAGITALLEQGVSDEEVRMAAGFASVQTLQVYDHPGKRLKQRLSRALLLDASDSSDSDNDVDDVDYDDW